LYIEGTRSLSRSNVSISVVAPSTKVFVTLSVGPVTIPGSATTASFTFGAGASPVTSVPNRKGLSSGLEGNSVGVTLNKLSDGVSTLF
tara:strand:- start:77 stop:340 length:264 start_codon:yes stop_codon:yes gene_type:complete